MHLRDIFFEKYIRYDVPKDRERQLYDFYLINTLDHYINIVTSPDVQTSVYSRLNDDDIATIEDAQTKLTNVLADELLDGVYFAICSEAMTPYKTEDDTFDFDLYQADEDLGPKEYNEFFIYLARVAARFSIDEPGSPGQIPKRYFRTSKNVLDQAIRRNYFSDEAKAIASREDFDFNSKRLIRLFAVELGLRKFGKTRSWFVEYARWLFSLPFWNSEYGGKQWSYICEEWQRLNRAERERDKLIGIDRLYQAQHNTNTVFNKLVTYYKDSIEWNWINQALDLKFRATTPAAFFSKATPSLRKIALKIIGDYNRVTGQKVEREYQFEIPQAIFDHVENVFSINVDKFENKCKILNQHPELNQTKYRFYPSISSLDLLDRRKIIIGATGTNGENDRDYRITLTISIDTNTIETDVSIDSNPLPTKTMHFPSIHANNILMIIDDQINHFIAEVAYYGFNDIKI